MVLLFVSLCTVQDQAFGVEARESFGFFSLLLKAVVQCCFGCFYLCFWAGMFDMCGFFCNLDSRDDLRGLL